VASEANGTRASREACLAALGVEPQVARELCARNVPLPRPAALPLGEDPQEADWEAILARKAGQNSWELLLSLYPQLHFAPTPGLASTEGWRGREREAGTVVLGELEIESAALRLLHLGDGADSAQLVPIADGRG
jgi:glycerate-2-kinase